MALLSETPQRRPPPLSEAMLSEALLSEPPQRRLHFGGVVKIPYTPSTPDTPSIWPGSLRDSSPTNASDSSPTNLSDSSPSNVTRPIEEVFDAFEQRRAWRSVSGNTMGVTPAVATPLWNSKLWLRRAGTLPLELLGLDISVTIADPSLPDCPLIACSSGFSKLTGYTLEEIVGRNCRFLLHGVPEELIDEEACSKSRAFIIEAAEGYTRQSAVEDIPEALKVKNPGLRMAQGEILCVQTNARKTGELFRNLFFMKTVDLADGAFIVGLQAGLGEGYVDDSPQSDKLRQLCLQAFADLNKNMGVIERLLADQRMQRQV